MERPIWETLKELGEKVPEEEWRKLMQTSANKDRRIAHLRTTLENIREGAHGTWAATYASEMLELDPA